jgi:hypothetical protein
MSLILLASYVLSIFGSHKLAKRLNRNATLWTVLAVFFGWISLSLLSVLEKNEITNSKISEKDTVATA